MHGFFLAILSFFSILYIILKFSSGFLPGCNITLISSTLILIVGLYIGKIFDQTKQRPLYIIEKSKNLNQV